jgi:hypothetical protein
MFLAIWCYQAPSVVSSQLEGLAGRQPVLTEDHRIDIEAWLQGLGLERYMSAFPDNEIDWEVLPKLTSEDLREIGIAAIGHRRKLLDAIAALCASTPTAAGRVPVPDASAPAEAERTRSA